MRIGEIVAAKRPVFSVEFFPPKTDEGRIQLFDTARSLAELELFADLDELETLYFQ